MSYMSVETRLSGKEGKFSSTEEFSMVVLGDFSGRASRALEEPPGRLSPVDRDNFFELFSAFDIQLKLPFDKQPIEFNDFDQLHPDYLLEQLDIFARFRQWQRKSSKPEHFAGLLEELRAANIWQDTVQSSAPQVVSSAPQIVSSTPPIVPRPPSAEARVDFLLEHVLTQRIDNTASSDAERLIKSIIAPYATAKADMRVPEVQNAITIAMAQTLRTILHHGDFHNLEATWRSLYFLVRRISSDKGIKIWLLDISEAELIAASTGDITQSPLFNLLVTQRQAAGQTPHNLILNLFSATTTADSLQWVTGLADIACAMGGACVAGGTPALAGCTDLIAQADPNTWPPVPEAFNQAWQALRARPAAAHLALTAPRFLLRSPYGKNSAPIESFDFTEITESQNHQHYLWGNSAVLVGVVLTELWLEGKGILNTAAASQIDQLPIHVEKSTDGERLIPSAEIVILDSTVAALRAAGLLVVRAIYNKNAVLIPALNSCATSGALLFAGE